MLNRFKKGIALLNQYSIINFASFIIGYPGETQETIEETISFIEQNQPTFYSLNMGFTMHALLSMSAEKNSD